MLRPLKRRLTRRNLLLRRCVVCKAVCVFALVGSAHAGITHTHTHTQTHTHTSMNSWHCVYVCVCTYVCVCLLAVLRSCLYARATVHHVWPAFFVGRPA